MQNPLSHYTLLADLFSYPDDGFADRVRAVQAVLDEPYPEAGAALEPFTAFVTQASLVEQEELFIRSFDVQSVTTLDMGYVLFGDDYKRGTMLVHLNREHREVDNPCYNELADHLPNVLRLLPKMKDAALRDELVERIVMPALRKMIGEFDPHTLGRKNKIYLKHHKVLIDRSEEYGTLYQSILIALNSVFEADFHVREESSPRPTSDFLKNIGTEIALEAE